MFTRRALLIFSLVVLFIILLPALNLAGNIVAIKFMHVLGLI